LFKKRIVHVTRPIATVEPHTAQFRIRPSASHTLGQIWVSNEYAPECYRVGHQGYIEGKNLVLDLRDAKGRLERIPTLMDS
jgi:hypothetical protein